MGLTLSQIVADLYMELFEQKALNILSDLVNS